jgi:hypothetical protein
VSPSQDSKPGGTSHSINLVRYECTRSQPPDKGAATIRSISGPKDKDPELE